MMRALLVIAALSLSVAPVSAQDAGQKMGQQQQQQAQETGDWEGLNVYSSNNELIGEVASVERTPAGEVRSLTVRTGQMLGLGEQTIEIDGEQAQKSGNRVTLQMSLDDVKQLPAVGPAGK